MNVPVVVFLDPIPVVVVPDYNSARQNSDVVTVLIIAMHVPEFVTHHPKPEIVVFLHLACHSIFLQVKAVFRIVDAPITVLIFFYIITVLVLQQQFAFVLDNLQPVFLIPMDSAFFVNDDCISIFINKSFFISI